MPSKLVEISSVSNSVSCTIIRVTFFVVFFMCLFCVIISNQAVIMENHGTVVGGHNLDDAITRFEVFETVAKTVVNASSLGGPRSLSDEQVRPKTPKPLITEIFSFLFIGYIHALQLLLAHPLHPQLLHSIVFPSSRSSLGTLHMHPVPNYLSPFYIHWRQHSFSYPFFFHFAMRAASANFSRRQNS